MRNSVNDIFLSLLSGLVLLITVRAAYALSAARLPDPLLMLDGNPLGSLALARLVLFAVLVALLALPLSWPLAKHAENRRLDTALPGAACALVLFLLLERVEYFSPFPRWLDWACGAVLFAALPLATAFWWRRKGAGS